MAEIVTASGADLSRAHLVGAGGAGMSAIGTILLDRGMAVSGSDIKESGPITALRARGAVTAIEQCTENLDLLPGGPTALVVSTAIRSDNPEVLEAQRRGIPVVRRADALAALMAGYRAVCVAGTHGKTSTTSMLTVALQQAGVDPSFAIGGQLTESGAGAHAGTGDIFVAEADESDGSLLAFSPRGAIITTIEPDHLDHHKTAEAYAEVFRQFVARIEPGGFVAAGSDDPGVRELVEFLRSDTAAGLPGVADRHVTTYGRGDDADVKIERIEPAGTGSRAHVVLPDGERHVLAVHVPGEHMVANAVAALCAGVMLGIDTQAMIDGLAAFTGVRRRFDLRGHVGAIRVYDDYAHHPTEVLATIRAARSIAGLGRVVVLFQPHLYSRTRQFAPQFAAALALADVVVVLDVFGARESPVPGVTGRLITDAMIGAAAQVQYCPSMAAAPGIVADLLQSDDVVMTMGAGDVTMLGPELLAELSARAPHTGGAS